MRLAWFTPLEPVQSGISTYSATILPRLRQHAIDLFVDDEVWRPRRREAVRQADGFGAVLTELGRIRWAHDFQPLHLRQPYDLIVYQLGNARCHDYMWPYLMRHPGLLVLHDAQLHQSRARALLQDRREDDFRAEFAACHPDAPAGVAEWTIAGLGNAGAPLWPLSALAIRASRAVAVHCERLAADLREAHPAVPIHTVRFGVPDLQAPGETGVPDGSLPDTRSGTVLFAAFGLITPEKRIPQILRGLAAIRAEAPHVRLRLVGGTVPHYDVHADAEECGVSDLVEITGYVGDGEFDRHIREADVCFALRWPTNREASGPWIRALSAGRATVVNDLIHLVDVPTLDPRTWEVLTGRTDPSLRRPALREAVAVSIDILDEDHSLALAMRRLALDAPLRASLGAAARRFWERDHTLDAMAADYERVLEAAAAREPSPEARGTLPVHLLADASGTLRRLAAETGVEVDWVG